MKVLLLLKSVEKHIKTYACPHGIENYCWLQSKYVQNENRFCVAVSCISSAIWTITNRVKDLRVGITYVAGIPMLPCQQKSRSLFPSLENAVVKSINTINKHVLIHWTFSCDCFLKVSSAILMPCNMKCYCHLYEVCTVRSLGLVCTPRPANRRSSIGIYTKAIMKR